MTNERSDRSYVPLTRKHLNRLSEIADWDHQRFTGATARRPEYANRRVAVVLAQGAAQHYLDCREHAAHLNGVNDLDVWTFYAAIPGLRWPAPKRHAVADFGPSELGRKLFDFPSAESPTQVRRWRRWDKYLGRRVDLLVRNLPVAPDAPRDEVIAALRDWLHADDDRPTSARRSNWYLAQRAVVLITPKEARGKVIWRGPASVGAGSS
jgi:hypothetical protein